MKNCICCKYKLYYYPTQLTCTYNTHNPRVRVRVCMGCTKCNPYLYPNTPVTEISQVYPYPCHTLGGSGVDAQDSDWSLNESSSFSSSLRVIGKGIEVDGSQVVDGPGTGVISMED